MKFFAMLLTLLCLADTATAVRSPVVRSTHYEGSYSNIVRYAAQSWMNSNNVHLTAEAWVFCEELTGVQTFIARHHSTNLWFGLNGNRLRFYRSGGTFADSDGSLVPLRWTHVAVTYDGSTARFFINGTNAGVQPLAHAGNDSTNSLCLGGQKDLVNFGDLFSGGYAFRGYLDEVRLWSVARFSSAIVAGMGEELRSGLGLLAAFGAGGDWDDIHGTSSEVQTFFRESGFGIHPRALCIPFTDRSMVADGVVDLLYEYRGAETMVLRSSDPFSSAPDQPAYLIRSRYLTGNDHLYVGVPDMPQAGLPQIPRLQVMCDTHPAGSDAPEVGDWECRLTQDGLQGGTRYDSNPPFFPTPAWLSWGQNLANWEGATLGSIEFHQSYEYRIHESHLNHFTNGVGLVVQYGNFLAGGELLTAPVDGVTNQPTTYTAADWCNQFADDGLRLRSYSGVVSNVTAGAGEAGWTVSLLSGPSLISATLISTVAVSPAGTFTLTVDVPSEFPTYVRLDSRPGYAYLPPEFYGTGYDLPSVVSENTVLTYPLCYAVLGCSYLQISFRVQSPPGAVSITSMSPTTGSPELVLRDTPLKVLPSTIVTLIGTNLHLALEVYLSKCPLDPPSFCTEDADIFRCTILSNDFERRTLTVQLPAAAANPNFFGPMQWVFKDTAIGHPGWTQWIYGPSGFLVNTTHPYPVLHGFEFENEDDLPTIQEFEACYGNSIFIYTPVPLRDPFYGLWSIVYMVWMDAANGSCYGMASTSRLLEEGTIPLGTYDGGHGVRYANGFPGNGLPPVAPKWGRWTGFDLFQPSRPINLWAQITANAGAQTSGEAIAFWLSQMRTPQTDGPRRGLNCGDPLAVLNRVRAMPGEYVICIGDRDFGRGHCLTPYGVLDEQGLMPDLRTRTNAPGFSLIQVYDNNHPGQERFVLVDRTLNIFRYEGEITGGPYEGPGLFWTPMSVFRGARHAPGPDSLGQFGVDYIRLLTMGAASASFTNAAGETAGWTSTGLSNNYAGALNFRPIGVLADAGTNQFSELPATMGFLPASNAPLAGTFVSRGSNILLYGAMGWTDIAFGFHAPDTEAINHVDELVMNSAQGLQAMGFRAGAPVRDFGIIVASRTDTAAQRMFEIEAGVDELTPNVRISREDALGLKLINRGTNALIFRLNISGVDSDHSAFALTYGFHTLPPSASVTFRLPPGTPRRLTRELDLDSDGTPEATEVIPAAGQLRADRESGQLALRWRRAARSETLESADKVADASWTPVGVGVTTEAPDQVARVSTAEPARFFRVRALETNCFDLSGFTPSPRPNPWDTNGFKFEAFSAFGAMLPTNEIVSRSGFTGLDVVHTMRVHPHDDYTVIHLDVFQTSGYVNFEAVGPLGVVVARASLTDPGTGPQRVTLRGFRERLHYVRVISPNAQCLLLKVCGEREPKSVSTNAPPACVSFEQMQPEVLNSPALFGVAELASSENILTIQPVPGGSVNGLKLPGLVTMQFSGSTGLCDRVTLRLLDPVGGNLVQAYDASGGVVLASTSTAASNKPQTIVLNGPGIRHVYLFFTQGQGHLLEFCCERNQGQNQWQNQGP